MQGLLGTCGFGCVRGLADPPPPPPPPPPGPAPWWRFPGAWQPIIQPQPIYIERDYDGDGGYAPGQWIRGISNDTVIIGGILLAGLWLRGGGR